MKIREFQTKYRVSDKGSRLIGEEIFLADKYSLELLDDHSGISVRWKSGNNNHFLIIPMENVRCYSPLAKEEPVKEPLSVEVALAPPNENKASKGLPEGLKAYQAKQRQAKQGK